MRKKERESERRQKDIHVRHVACTLPCDKLTKRKYSLNKVLHSQARELSILRPMQINTAKGQLRPLF